MKSKYDQKKRFLGIEDGKCVSGIKYTVNKVTKHLILFIYLFIYMFFFQEETLLQMEIKDLKTFKEFLNEIKTHEKNDRLFLAKLETIDGKINRLIGSLRDLVRESEQ